jgi:TonB family protein
MSGNTPFEENHRALSRGLLFSTIFALLVLLSAGAAAQASPPVCAAMCDSGPGPIIYRVGGDVSQPTVLRRVEPEYPEEARAASISGGVAICVEVRPDGIAHNIRVTRGLASVLNQSAIDAIRQWRFQPATKNGQPVTVEANIELTFRPPSGAEADKEIQASTEATPAPVTRPFHVGDSMEIVVSRVGKPYKISKGGKDEAGRTIVVYHYKDYHVGSVVFVDGKVFEGVVRDAKEAAKAAAEAAREASDHLTVPLSGWISQTASGEPDCLALHDMAFHRDIQRGWGGLLGGGRNAFLGVSSSLAGVVSNTCARELLVSIYGKFFNSSGFLLGEGSVDILVPASESRAFQVPWACSDGANYIGSESTTWIPNCPADTARYGVRHQ